MQFLPWMLCEYSHSIAERFEPIMQKHIEVDTSQPLKTSMDLAIAWLMERE